MTLHQLEGVIMPDKKTVVDNVPLFAVSKDERYIPRLLQIDKCGKYETVYTKCGTVVHFGEEDWNRFLIIDIPPNMEIVMRLLVPSTN